MHRLALEMTVRVSRKEDMSKYCSGVCVSQKWHCGTVTVYHDKNFLGNIFFADFFFPECFIWFSFLHLQHCTDINSTTYRLHESVPHFELTTL